MFYIHSSKKQSEKLSSVEDEENKGKVFEDRIQALRKKGKKRGKRYSLIGILISSLIFLFTMTMGYILIEQISQISKKVNLVNVKNNFQNVIDPDMHCKTSCCLASLEKMRRFKYSELNENGGCEEGYFIDKLQCDTSLEWCELIEDENTELID